MELSNNSVEREKEITSEKKKIWKNVIIISLGFLFVFTAFQSMSNLQSSINVEAGLGSYSLATIYGSLVLSCIFLPSIVMKHLSVKNTMWMSMLGYNLYILAQFYPTFGTLIPAAIVLGLCAALMWSAKCTYLNVIGSRYSKLGSSLSPETVTVKFFGMFFAFFQTSSIWGNLISSTVLSGGADPNFTRTPEELDKCGPNYCSWKVAESADQTLIEQPSKSSIYTLAGVFLGSSIIGVLIIALGVDPLIKFQDGERAISGTSGRKLLMATIFQLIKPLQLLLIPLTIYSGLEQGLFLSDFTSGFVACGIGTHMIGYVLMSYGALDVLSSFSLGYIMRHTGRGAIFLVGMALNLGVMATFLTWTPQVGQVYPYFLMAGVWGISDGIWQTQINAFYGVIFQNDEEAAYSNYRLWESLGFIVAFILNTNSCLYENTVFLMCMLCLGILGYVIIEILVRKSVTEVKEDMTGAQERQG